ncbi:sigma-54 interaction domain-containing protein [Brevibacillus choshinensis]|uniref:sigma-54 interaction domain-containing protein n=1 Tax=Brevibacillus choshinensis TaxID=54911 RepID=UPI002E1D8AFD|nr:sigma 54-interacting transcriptional regulator [Brevibacillus choshinensis]MED4754745.1 sigma 54-interacting transcriptional regulator [Brevibacillus choshinensis]MED4784734.1 sigma 54-interacting transcriptional regulator [Brevibacillus choshinensis]
MHLTPIHRIWWVNEILHGAEEIFNDAQMSELQTVLDLPQITFVRELVRQQINEPSFELMSEFICPPFTFMLIRTAPTMLVTFAKDGPRDAITVSEQVTDENHFIAVSEEMKHVIDIIRKVSYVDSTVLLLGKSGVGKSAIAKLIHKNSERANSCFISVNCGAIPAALMEAELFGYMHGSFTGGQKGGKEGLFEAAEGGTIFLDEISELPFNLQVKLLEVLQENSIRRLGATQSIPINVRVIAATNADLFELVGKKLFREDLYYRLNVVPLEIPPLNKRPEDIRELTAYFLKKYTRKHRVQKQVHRDVEIAFESYEWPGNVRELENIVERLVVTVADPVIQTSHLPASFQHSTGSSILDMMNKSDFLPLKEAKKLFEKELILKAYDTFQNMYKVAEALEVDQSTISKKIKEYRS